MSLYLIKLHFTSNFLDQNNPKSKYSKCKNELIYIRVFEAVQYTCSGILSGLTPQGKTGVPREESLQVWARLNQQKTQPTYDVASGILTKAKLVGVKSSHHYATLCPKKKVSSVKHCWKKEPMEELLAYLFCLNLH